MLRMLLLLTTPTVPSGKSLVVISVLPCVRLLLLLLLLPWLRPRESVGLDCRAASPLLLTSISPVLSARPRSKTNLRRLAAGPSSLCRTLSSHGTHGLLNSCKITA